MQTSRTTALTGRARSLVAGHRRDVVTLGAIALIGLLLRILYLVFGTAGRPLTSDASQYFEIARHLARGQGFSMKYPGLLLHETAFRPPGYPLFLSGFFAIFGPSAGLARALNVVLGLIVVSLTYAVVRRYVGYVGAIFAALGVAVMPNLIANDTYVLDEPLALCFLLALIWAVIARRWWTAGVFCGLLILTRPSAQFFIVVLIVWLLFHADWRAVLKVAALTLVVVAPWMVRNWIQVGQPIIVTSNGYNWAAIYSPAAQKAGGFIDPVSDPAYNHDRLLQFDELAWSSTLQAQGIKALEAHPSYLAHTIKDNLGAFLEIRTAINNAPEKLDGRDLRVVHDTLWVFYLELGVGLAGLVVARRTQLAQLFALEGAYFTVASLFFIAVPRLRAPLDLALAVGVGLSADWVATRRARPRPNPLTTGDPDRAAAQPSVAEV